MENYTIAIPSYKRAKTLNNKTLRVLKEYDIHPKRIVIFVANQTEHDVYRKYISNEYKIVIGE